MLKCSYTGALGISEKSSLIEITHEQYLKLPSTSATMETKELVSRIHQKNEKDMQLVHKDNVSNLKQKHKKYKKHKIEKKELHFRISVNNATNTSNSLIVDFSQPKNFHHLPRKNIKCIPEQCQYCCLNENFCGSKSQCELTGFTVKIFRIFFIILSTLMFLIFTYKFYETDSEPEHTKPNRSQERDLQLLVTDFWKERQRRKKSHLQQIYMQGDEEESEL